MIFNYLKKNKILFITLFFLLSITILILIKVLTKQDKPSTMNNETQIENKILKSKPKAEPNVATKSKQEVKSEIQSPLLQKKIDFIGKNNLLMDSKPTIDQIMEKQKKLDILTQEKDLTEGKEEWEVDYGVGLEKGAIETLKNNPELKHEMLNVKVGFSKSF